MVESDEEQVEVLKKWWEENGTSLVITVVLALGGTIGYRAWENNVQETGEAASVAYENLVSAVENIDPNAEDQAMSVTAFSLGESLKTDYESSAYATFAAMHLAKISLDSGDTDRAQSELEWALSQVSEPHLETIIRIRLARLLVDKDDPTAAITQLINHKPAKGQVATFEEAKGDIYHMLGDMDSARQSYQLALENLNEDVQKPVLEIKLADIPRMAAQPAASSADAESDASEGEDATLDSRTTSVEEDA